MEEGQLKEGKRVGEREGGESSGGEVEIEVEGRRWTEGGDEILGAGGNEGPCRADER